MNDIVWNEKSIRALATFLAEGKPRVVEKYLQAPKRKYILTWDGQPDERGLKLAASPACSIVRLQIGVRAPGFDRDLWCQGYFIRNAVMLWPPNGAVQTFLPVTQNYQCEEGERWAHMGAFFLEDRPQEVCVVTIVPKAPARYFAHQLKRFRNCYQLAKEQKPDCAAGLVLCHTLVAYCADFPESKPSGQVAPIALPRRITRTC
jgi:hypothetical protein